MDSLDSGKFYGHPEYKWKDSVIGGTVRSGRFHTISGDKDYETVF